MYERFLLSRVGPNTYPDLVAKLFRFLSQLFQLTHCSCLTGTRDDNVLDLQSKHHTMTSHALTSIKHCSSDACSHDHVHASNLINIDFLEPIPMHVYVPDNRYLFTVIKSEVSPFFSFSRLNNNKQLLKINIFHVTFNLQITTIQTTHQQH